MLSRIDRVQMAVPDRAAAAAGWVALLGAEPAGEDRVACLGAKRSRLRVGQGWVELLAPDGAGPVADAVAARGAHLFAGGTATSDFDGLLARLRAQGAEPTIEGGQAFLDPAQTGIPGLRLVVSPDEALQPVGAIDTFYEVTPLVPDAPAAVAECAARFDLDGDAFVTIASKNFGYSGSLTLFRSGHLHRFEIITPTDPSRTMGRYFDRFGPALYMAFAETGELTAIEERALDRGAGFTADRPDGRAADQTADQIWLHPPALGGMMLGLSRRTMAWSWSGSPERVEEVAA